MTNYEHYWSLLSNDDLSDFDSLDLESTTESTAPTTHQHFGSTCECGRPINDSQFYDNYGMCEWCYYMG